MTERGGGGSCVGNILFSNSCDTLSFNTVDETELGGNNLLGSVNQGPSFNLAEASSRGGVINTLFVIRNQLKMCKYFLCISCGRAAEMFLFICFLVFGVNWNRIGDGTSM